MGLRKMWPFAMWQQSWLTLGQSRSCGCCLPPRPHRLAERSLVCLWKKNTARLQGWRFEGEACSGSSTRPFSLPGSLWLQAKLRDPGASLFLLFSCLVCLRCCCVWKVAWLSALYLFEAGSHYVWNSLHSPGWPGTHRDLSFSASQSWDYSKCWLIWS